MADQGTKKLVSDSPGLVDFTLNLKGKLRVKFGGHFFEEIRTSWKVELLCTLLTIEIYIF